MSQVEGELKGRVKRVMIPIKRTTLNRMCGRRHHCQCEIKRILDQHKDLAGFPSPSCKGIWWSENRWYHEVDHQRWGVYKGYV